MGKRASTGGGSHIGKKTPTMIAVAWCNDHNKLAYGSRKDARRAARKNPDTHKSAYRCETHPGTWHNGALHPSVIAGARGRRDFKGTAA
jgi:endonuclease I